MQSFRNVSQHQPRVLSRSRKGLAMIELVMAMPLLIFCWILLYTIAGAYLTKSSVLIEARHEAWSQRDPVPNEETLSAPGMDLVGQVLEGSNSPDPESGLSRGESEADLKWMAPGQLFPLGTAKGSHEVLESTWDYRVLPFPSHAPLTVDRRAIAFIEPAAIFAFKDLLNFTGISSGGGFSIWQAGQQQVELARWAIRQEIRRLEGKRVYLKLKLRRLLNAEEVNESLINQVKRELRKVEQELAQARSALSHLNRS